MEVNAHVIVKIFSTHGIRKMIGSALTGKGRLKMHDREKLIEGWERCNDCVKYPIGTSQAYLDCEYTIGLYCAREILFRRTLDFLKSQPDIVRCKDCKYWSAERINDFNKCRRWINVGVKNFATIGDWFCADGEQK